MTAEKDVSLMVHKLWIFDKNIKPMGKTGVNSEGHNDTFGNSGIGKPRGISPTTGIISAPSFQNVHNNVQAMITSKMKRFIDIKL